MFERPKITERDWSEDGKVDSEEINVNYTAISALPALMLCVEEAYNEILEVIELRETMKGWGKLNDDELDRLIAIRDKYRAALEQAGYKFN